MNSGVPTGMQVVEGLGKLLQAAAKADSLQLREWIGQKNGANVLKRVLNARPEYILGLLENMPVIEDVRFKAKLLGVEDRLDGVKLPLNATGWHFADVPLAKYALALEHLGLTRLTGFKQGCGEYWENVFPAEICTGGRKEEPLFHDPIHIVTKRKVVETNPSSNWGSRMLGLEPLFDLMIDRVIYAVLRGRDARTALMNTFQIKMGNDKPEVLIGPGNHYRYQAIHRDQLPDQAVWKLLVILYPDNKLHQRGFPSMMLTAVPVEDYASNINWDDVESVYEYFIDPIWE